MLKKNQKGFVLMEVVVVTVFVAIIFTLLYAAVIPVMGEYEREEKYDAIDSKYVAHLVVKNLKLNSVFAEISPFFNNVIISSKKWPGYNSINFAQHINDSYLSIPDGSCSPGGYSYKDDKFLCGNYFWEITDPDTVLDNQLEIRGKDSADNNATLSICGLSSEYCDGAGKVYLYATQESRDKVKELVDEAGIEKIYITNFNLSQLQNYLRTSSNNPFLPNDGTTPDDSDIDVAEQVKDYVLYLPSFGVDWDSFSNARLIIATRDIYENDTLNFGTIEFSF